MPKIDAFGCTRDARKKFAVALAIVACASGSAFAQDAEAPFDKYMKQGQNYYDGGNFVQAEKTWRKALSESQKAQDNAKTLNAMVSVGKSLIKENKFPQAQDMLKQAADLAKEQNLDSSALNAANGELNEVYRPIDWSKMRQDVNKFLTDVGTQIAYATRNLGDATTHIFANLASRYQKGMDDLYKEYGPKDKPADAANGGTASQSKENPVKAIKLDKKISFDVIRESDSKYRVANINGIYANVGLWVKLSDMLIGLDDQNKPYAEVRAGKFGISKSQRVDMPLDAYNQLKEGVNQLDPFALPAAAATTATTPSPDVTATGGAGSAHSPAANGASAGNSAPPADVSGSTGDGATGASTATSPVTTNGAPSVSANGTASVSTGDVAPTDTTGSAGNAGAGSAATTTPETQPEGAVK
ncbi:MAG TPA: hypothetical protein V6D17_04265 [Candidatus Obscuribacterales bacterium]